LQKKPNLLSRIFRFFFPKNFMAEVARGKAIGNEMMSGKKNPAYMLGKGVRKVVDPKHNTRKHRNLPSLVCLVPLVATFC